MDNNAADAVIYVVDDEFSIRDSMTVFIESTGRSCKCFDSAKAFLQEYDANKPGCLILDVKMPEMDGLALQQELHDRDINLPIVFISGNAEIQDSAKAFRSGAVDFLEKPFDIKVMLQRIEEAINKDINARKTKMAQQKLQERLACLTPRENEVMQLIVNGHSNKEAAKVLQISPRTVEAHRNNVLKKNQVADVNALIKLLAKHSFLNEKTPD